MWVYYLALNISDIENQWFLVEKHLGVRLYLLML